MKCRCPACGRSTEIEPAMLDFFTRCNRCGVLLRPLFQNAKQDETQGTGLEVRVVPIGRGREGLLLNGQIADLLSRPPTMRTPSTPAAVAVTREIPLAEPFAPIPPPVTKALQPVRPPVREPRRSFGAASVCGLAVIATIVVAGLAIKSNISSPRSASAQNNIPHPAPASVDFTPGENAQTDNTPNAPPDLAPASDAQNNTLP